MEITIASKTWFPAYEHEIPQWAKDKLDELMQKSSKINAAVKSPYGKCYMCFIKGGKKYYGIA